MHVHDFLAEGRMEMFNLNCKLINFLNHLKERAGVDSKGTGLKCWIIFNCSYTNSKSNKILPADCVDLMDSSGKVMNLAAKQHNLALASSVLVARHYYILLRVCRDHEAGGQKYVSLQNNNSQSHPELTELLKRLTDKEPDRKTRKRRMPQTKNIPANSKSH
ncbi:uncharacterized protein C22orf15 isoform X1 [Astatotilapia calliptera]|uniref:uncharacterized protein C22orf15 isoform X1 n=1 Tax=Astatotilapia calliptera TaxID=8154 RepID=UPI000E42ABFB|nr:uncharacterized protein C22orf15 homolog isoform X1 [Astatotilapia calliptera]